MKLSRIHNIAVVFLVAIASASQADELSRRVEAVLAAGSGSARRGAIDAVVVDPASRDLATSQALSALLHRSARFEKIPPGTMSLEVALEDGSKREVVVRVPARYSPDRAWPMIVAYHGTGGTGSDLIDPLAQLLGKSADEFLIAGPSQYEPANIDSRRSWRPEHRLVLQALKQKLHINSDRVYVAGFSGGGYVAWSHALYFGDEYAAAMPVACAFDAAPEIPGFWENLLPNIRNIPVLNVWGANDRLPVLSIDLEKSAGTNNVLNKRLEKLARDTKITALQSCELPGVGHAFAPPADRARRLFAKVREQSPKQVSQRFRYLVEGRAYWMEALAWEGDQWGLGPREMPDVPGGSRQQAIGEMIDSTLANLVGKIDGQEISIERTHVGRLAVWLGDGMIDFAKPLRVTVNGKVAFEGKVDRDLRVALMQACRTRDFDRIRWAGVMIEPGGAGRLITVADDFSDVVWEKPR